LCPPDVREFGPLSTNVLASSRAKSHLYCYRASKTSHNCIAAMPRKTFTNHEKLSFLATAKERRAKGEPLRSIARSMNVQAKQLREWERSSESLVMTRTTAKSICTGRKSVLTCIEDELLAWISSMREQGKVVSVKMAVLKASDLDPNFRHKSYRAKDQCMRRFLTAQKARGERISTTDKAKASIAELIEEDYCVVVSEVPTMPGNLKKQKRWYTVEEAWKMKHTAAVDRNSTRKKEAAYQFVFPRLRCEDCCPWGSSGIPIGDEQYFHDCSYTKRWYDTQFISAFCSMVAHDAHLTPPKLKSEKFPQMVLCPFPHAAVELNQTKKVKPGVTHLVATVFANLHYAVLKFTLEDKSISVYDGLNYKITTWTNHVVHILKKYSLASLKSRSKISYSQSTEGLPYSHTAQLVTITIGDEIWTMRNKYFHRQKDAFNCGPIACLKVMEIFGIIDEGEIENIRERKGGYRVVVMSHFRDLIQRWNKHLMVEMGSN